MLKIMILKTKSDKQTAKNALIRSQKPNISVIIKFNRRTRSNCAVFRWKSQRIINRSSSRSTSGRVIPKAKSQLSLRLPLIWFSQTRGHRWWRARTGRASSWRTSRRPKWPLIAETSRICRRIARASFKRARIICWWSSLTKIGGAFQQKDRRVQSTQVLHRRFLSIRCRTTTCTCQSHLHHNRKCRGGNWITQTTSKWVTTSKSRITSWITSTITLWLKQSTKMRMRSMFIPMAAGS